MVKWSEVGLVVKDTAGGVELSLALAVMIDVILSQKSTFKCAV